MPDEEKDKQAAEMEAEEKQDGEKKPETVDIEEVKRLRKALKEANSEAAERRKKLETLEAAEKKRAEAEMSELEKAQKATAETTANLTKLKEENRQLKLRMEFDHKASELELAFVNPTAAEDAFKALDMDIVGDDFSGMEKAIKKLQEDREYFFSKSMTTTTQPVNDGRQKGKGNQAILTQEAINQKRSQISPL